MEQETTFESLLNKHRIVVERYIHFRMPSSFDAEDVIQETYTAAYIGFSHLQNHDLFKSWILSIARNQCNLWYRNRYGVEFLPLESASEIATIQESMAEQSAFHILNEISCESAELLQLTMNGYKQKEIANHLGIPIGTVKSRLHYAKKQFRSACTPEQLLIFEKGRKNMAKKDYTCGFPMKMPTITITESTRPFVAIKCEEEEFIIPRLGNQNSEGTYRYPDQTLACVSTCYVPKAATIHDVAGVKICRDTYNIKSKKLHKNECIWFSQLTDEYIRDLATIMYEEDDENPTAIYTFLDEYYDVVVNDNDRIHGRKLLIQENPPKIEDHKIYIDKYNMRYTMGTCDVTIGNRTFETIKFIRVQNNVLVTENFVDTNGRLVLMRWYEQENYLEENANYTDDFVQRTTQNPTITVNDIVYRLMEVRINQYAL